MHVLGDVMGVGHRMRAHIVYTGPRACGNEDKAMIYCVALQGTTSWGANTHLSKSFLHPVANWGGHVSLYTGRRGLLSSHVVPHEEGTAQ